MPDDQRFSWTRFRETPIIGILRGLAPSVCTRIAGVCADTGYYTLEVTMNTRGAEGIIATLRNRFPQLNVGAGTVCNLEDYERALAAGAQFIVTPVLDEEVILGAVAEDIPVFPGAYTPTEIYRAWSLGGSAVKVFPAGQLGPGYLRDVAGPLGEVRLLPTGGVDRDNIRSYFEAGAYGVGMGSGLLDKEMIKDEDYRALRQHFADVRSRIEDLL
ncbi:bifunctional 4-hydroxy-2-oxoglutarate aldolase/2-dehydro-3-deoxy-phosphogluconate aldolase [Lewinella sp. IMCC34183]|uniref:bifunctional 4-hydroxy-2-oxoglutarate aldolase/2-dehydro-3-deoxy-phosphogluconate aldolase n=1 Tax=Lewinella sp. IMCC34183 TaxID=2248762 RepID=UPI000E255720|nr:bifunctional 4-hydroxy-2-oxoglutarate aldolase/2-dehydro-3-deoxy-phosphogluconate aldolase [Lewinella sp. IMCC34183]